MKKTVLTIVIALLASANGDAQNLRDPFLTDETRPNPEWWLPDPPELTSAQFTYDFYWYQNGRVLREEGAVAERALYDERAELCDVFSPEFGLELSPETTPEILTLAEHATTDANKANQVIKNKYQRKRPFAQFHEPSLKPWTDEEEASTYSYPSGHSSRGWMYALVLSTVAPDRLEALLSRASEYAHNRVICGHHWKTDIDASALLAAGIFAAVVCTDAYQEQLVKARQEYQRLKGEETGISSTRTATKSSAKIYRLDGSPATSDTRGIVIKGGKKVAVSPYIEKTFLPSK